MQITLDKPIYEKIVTVNKETGFHEVIDYIDWCKRVVDSINLGNVEKYRQAQLVQRNKICWVDGWGK